MVSIQSEITRISGNVADALDAIENKGVTIPAGSNSDDLADLIGQISPPVVPTLQTKTNISPTESSQTIEADAGYDGLDSVQINAIPSNYVGSGVTQRSSNDLTASGATVTAPAGYYSSTATKSVASGSAATPATTITANPSISVSSGGLITATASATQSVTPTVSAGYVSTGTAGTITVSGSNTSQLTTQAAQTIYPSTSDQTISSGKYLTGAQTVKGVLLTNLTAANIANGVTVKVGDSADDDRVVSVTGTYSGSTPAEYTAYVIVATSVGDTVYADYFNIDPESNEIYLPILTEQVSVTPSTTSQFIYPEAGCYGLEAVYVNPIPSQYIIPSGNKAITANGNNIDVAAYSTVSVNVSFSTIRTGSGTPSSSLGSDGDIYIQTS